MSIQHVIDASGVITKDQEPDQTSEWPASGHQFASYRPHTIWMEMSQGVKFISFLLTLPAWYNIDKQNKLII